MATNDDIPAGDTEMAECDGEVVTMMDVLKEQQDFEDDANAVLGGSDEKECTYSQGYIKRQAIYACMTCCPESKDDPSKRAGFCLACSLNCHENHDLVELYTKRNFRCDCGNPKFKTSCQFTTNKPELNEENVYNQNFVGLYCSCSKPYGDQESTLDDEMIQCIICEDWWHANHLDAVVPANDQYSEMICKLCMTKNEFLHDYGDLAVNVETEEVDVVKVNGADGNTESDDKLTNGSIIDEKLVNGGATDEKLTNGMEEGSTSNDMETNTTKDTSEASPASNNENKVNSIEKESTEAEKLEDENIETEKPVESEENKSDAPMDTDETDKAADILPEFSSDYKPEITIDKSEDSEPSDKTEELAPKEKAEENILSLEEKTEGNYDPSAEKKDISEVSADKKEDNNKSADKTMNVTEEKAGSAECTEAADKSDEKESSVQADSETPNTKHVSEVTENTSFNMEDNESKLTEDKENENDAPQEEESTKTEGPSAELDKPSVEPNETSSDIAKPAETSQDEDMKDKEKETVSEDSPEDTSKVDKPVNDDSKESDSTNKTDSELNENIVPELASTENKRKINEDVTGEISVKKPKLDDSKCIRPKGVKKVHKGATFWPATLRQKLCTCNECISMYKDLSVLFLTDLEDTVFAYETLGKERTAGNPNQYEKGMQALCSLGRIQQIDALTEYNKMRDKLLTFLQSFKDKKEIVTENDIKTFFAGMKPEKRMDGVYFCR